MLCFNFLSVRIASEYHHTKGLEENFTEKNNTRHFKNQTFQGKQDNDGVYGNDDDNNGNDELVMVILMVAMVLVMVRL